MTNMSLLRLYLSSGRRVSAITVATAAFFLSAASGFSQNKDYLTPTPAAPSETVAGGTTKDVVITYSATEGGQGTTYAVTVAFGIDTSTSTASGSVVSHKYSENAAVSTSCVMQDATSCEVTVRVTAPAADPVSDKTYKVVVKNTLNQSVTPGKQFRGVEPVEILVNVPKAVPEAIETVVSMQNECGVLKGNNVTLKARLTTNAGAALSGMPLEFFVGSASQGLATTDMFGNAEKSVAVDTLNVGDVSISAVFSGQAPYVGNSGGAKLGINYMFQGFMPPVNADGTSIFKNGRVIPFKIKILDGQANGLITNAKPEIGMVKLSNGTAGADTEMPITGTPDAAYLMRYAGTTDDQYIYNWDLTPLTNGSYRVMVDLNDSLTCGGWRPTLHETLISIDKKK